MEEGSLESSQLVFEWMEYLHSVAGEDEMRSLVGKPRYSPKHFVFDFAVLQEIFVEE